VGRLTSLGVVAGLLAVVLLTTSLHGQRVTPTVLMVTDHALSSVQSDAAALDEVRRQDQTVTELQRASRLRRRSLEADREVPGRTFERLDQIHQGVRVFGADITRQTNEFGQAVSVFGTIYDTITVDTAPKVNAARAALILALAGKGVVGKMSEQELVVLPLDSGARLTWTARVFSKVDGHVERIFVDAQSGAVVHHYNDTWTQALLATGTGLAGDTLTMPVAVTRSLLTGSVLAIDLKRPGANTTFDLKGDPVRATALLNGTTPFSDRDIAADRDNKDWNPVVLSAHTYAGYVYDYYLNNFGRHGLDDHNIMLRLIVNPAKPETQSSLGTQYPGFFSGASYWGNGVVSFGVGAPAGGGGPIGNRAGSLDLVGHELTHGVTQFTSKLVYQDESGALNESFSDIMGVCVEFDNQPMGSGPARADWLFSEDSTPSGTGVRNFITPHAKGDPDHYSIRLITTPDDDNGGVHVNSSISNHAFYLAVMGGTNRVSGLSVEGVGFSNRKQMEHVFYRAFTQILTASSTFSNARAACIQAARDLYGVGSAAERAVTQAWDAVGVF
jgi:thermolysin